MSGRSRTLYAGFGDQPRTVCIFTHIEMAAPTGLEPAISCVTGKQGLQLPYEAALNKRLRSIVNEHYIHHAHYEH